MWKLTLNIYGFLDMNWLPISAVSVYLKNLPKRRLRANAIPVSDKRCLHVEYIVRTVLWCRSARIQVTRRSKHILHVHSVAVAHN